MLGVKPIDKIPNAVCQEISKIIDILLRILRIKWKLAGHLAHWQENRWTITIMQGQDKRIGGRAPMRWTNDLKRTTTYWIEATQEHDNWKRLEDAYMQQWMMAAG